MILKSRVLRNETSGGGYSIPCSRAFHVLRRPRARGGFAFLDRFLGELVWTLPDDGSPIFEALAAEFEPLVRFAKVDTDAEREIAEHFRIRTIPTLSLVRHQREVARVDGVLYTGDLRRWLYGALSEPEDEQASP